MNKLLPLLKDKMKITDEMITAYHLACEDYWRENRHDGTVEEAVRAGLSAAFSESPTTSMSRKMQLLQQSCERSHAEVLRLAEKLKKYELRNVMHLNAAQMLTDMDVVIRLSPELADYRLYTPQAMVDAWESSRPDPTVKETAEETNRRHATSDWKAMLAASPTPLAKQGEQELKPAFSKDALWGMEHILAALRAKVEALPNMTAYDRWCRKDAVLAEIDKMGGGV